MRCAGQSGMETPRIRPEVPEDVLAEMDLEERRLGIAATPPPPADEVPEDVLGEQDHAARLASEDLRARLVEGGPPPEEEEPPA